ncbi:hypothetical protein GOBAR_AA27502 [Gossypium barbadense]|uniref:Uncharacterized protein n=1 Tax=Gossypium barbadense TaxID=3634 RepID=A0A2P5WQ11_GOSBA|nr:hypothetical protein GOBAR_AA27502 [Gossypium barbadense]
MWNNQYDFLPTREPIIVPELACDPEAGETSQSSTPTQEPAPTAVEPMPTPPTSQFPMSGWNVMHLSPMYYMLMPSAPLPTKMPMMMYKLSMSQAPMESPLIIPSVYKTQHSYVHLSFVTQTPSGSLIYQAGSSSQPSILRPKNAQ